MPEEWMPDTLESRLTTIPDDRIYHVYPTFGREHITDKADKCWCCPEDRFVNNGAMIIHEAEQ